MTCSSFSSKLLCNNFIKCRMVLIIMSETLFDHNSSCTSKNNIFSFNTLWSHFVTISQALCAESRTEREICSFFTHTDVSRGKADIVAGFVFQSLPVKPWIAVHKAQHVEAETKSATTSAQVLKRAWFHFLSSTRAFTLVPDKNT
jgi:hypothetical protein